MPTVKNRLPPLPELRARFIADFDAGTLTINPAYKGNLGRGKRGTHAGWVDSDGRIRVSVAGQPFPISRVLWTMHTGRDPGLNYVDHIDGNPLNNAIGNLRLVTPGENRMNSVHVSAAGSKGITMVWTRKGEPRYKVQVCRVVGKGEVGAKGSRDGNRRKTYHYGTYKTLDAAKARYAEVIKEWGMEDYTRSEYANPTPSDLPEALKALPDQCDDATLNAFVEYVGLTNGAAK